MLYFDIQYNCCGIDGHDDWLIHNTLLSHRPPAGPASCCAESADLVVGGASRCVRLFRSGCHGHLVAYEDRQYSIMGPIGLAFGAFQVYNNYYVHTLSFYLSLALGSMRFVNLKV